MTQSEAVSVRTRSARSASKLAAAVVLSIGASIAVASCATPAILEPPTGPGTDYPCGVTGVECHADRGYCCSGGDVCGGDDWSCPAHQCCYVGTDDEVLAKRMTPKAQFRAR